MEQKKQMGNKERIKRRSKDKIENRNTRVDTVEKQKTKNKKNNIESGESESGFVALWSRRADVHWWTRDHGTPSKIACQTPDWFFGLNAKGVKSLASVKIINTLCENPGKMTPHEHASLLQIARFFKIQCAVMLQFLKSQLICRYLEARLTKISLKDVFQLKKRFSERLSVLYINEEKKINKKGRLN